MKPVSELHPGETILYTGTVYLTWLQMLWSDARVQVTNQRLLWEPFENFPCELPLDQVSKVSSTALVVLTRTVIAGHDGSLLAVLTRGRVLPDLLAGLVLPAIAGRRALHPHAAQSAAPLRP